MIQSTVAGSHRRHAYESAPREARRLKSYNPPHVIDLKILVGVADEIVDSKELSFVVVVLFKSSCKHLQMYSNIFDDEGKEDGFSGKLWKLTVVCLGQSVWYNRHLFHKILPV